MTREEKGIIIPLQFDKTKFKIKLRSLKEESLRRSNLYKLNMLIKQKREKKQEVKLLSIRKK
ncbi:hypothetical protein ACOTV0_09665, partial [Aliarcobacter butzleri]